MFYHSKARRLVEKANLVCVTFQRYYCSSVCSKVCSKQTELPGVVPFQACGSVCVDVGPSITLLHSPLTVTHEIDPEIESYYPYFHSNSQCEHLFDELRKNLGNTELPDLYPFGNQKSAGSFSEDEWTERLHVCLKLNNIKAELTTPYRSYNVSKSWEQRLPTSVDKRCLLFQGSPDIVIILAEDRMEGVLIMLQVWSKRKIYE